MARGPILISRRPPGVVLEPRVLADEGELDGPDGPVPLLADDDLRDALVGRVFVVDLVAVDEEDHVGVLLQGPAVMADDSVREPAGRTRNSEVEDLLLAGRFDSAHAIPGERLAAPRMAVRRRQPRRAISSAAGRNDSACGKRVAASGIA